MSDSDNPTVRGRLVSLAIGFVATTLTAVHSYVGRRGDDWAWVGYGLCPIVYVIAVVVHLWNIRGSRGQIGGGDHRLT